VTASDLHGEDHVHARPTSTGYAFGGRAAVPELLNIARRSRAARHASLRPTRTLVAGALMPGA
jgi:hypothetical protein